MAIPRALSMTLRWMAISALALLLALAALYGLLHTRAGLDFAAEKVSGALSGGGTRVHIGRVTGSIGSALEIEKLTVADADGIYASAEGIRLQWNPLALFRRVVDVEALTVKRFALDRLPRQQAPAKSAGPVALPPLGIRADRIAIEEIALGAPVLGAPERMTAKAALRIAKDLGDAALKLSLKRTDGGPDRAEVELGYAADPMRVTARVEIEEPKGGLLARLAGLAPGTPLSVRLKGVGPAEEWRGQFDLEAGDRLSARSSVLIALEGGAVKLAIDGKARFARLLPAELAPLARPSVSLRATLGLTPGEALTVTGLTAESEALELSGSGRYGFANETIAATLAAKVRAARPLAGLIPGLALTSPALEARLAGTVSRPRLDLALKTARVAAGPARAETASGTFTAAARANGAFDLQTRLRFTGFQPWIEAPRGVFGSEAELRAAGLVERDGSLHRLTATLVSGPSALDVTGGRVSASAAEGRYRLAIREIAPLAGEAGLALKGKFQGSGAFQAHFATGAVTATAEGALGELSGGPDWLHGLLGSRVPFSGAVAWREGEPLEVKGLTIKPAAGTVKVAGALDIASGTLSAETDIAIPKLTALSGLAGSKLAGAVRAKAAVTGSFSNPRVSGQARFKKLGVDGRVLGSLGVGFSARTEGEALAAALHLRGTVIGKPLAGRLTARWAGETLELREVDLTLAGNKVQGRLDYGFPNDRLSGALTATVKDMSALPGLEAASLAGSAEARITADPEGKGTIEITATARGLKASGGGFPASVDAADITLQLKDPLGDPAITGEAKMTYRLAGMSAPGHGRLTVRGTLSRFDWTSELAVSRPYAAALGIKGSAELRGTGSRIDVASLQGNFEKQPVALQGPFSIALGQGAWRVSPLDLGFAGGRVRMTAAMEGEALDAKGEIEGLPLKLAALIDSRAAIDGTASGRFRIQGPLAGPKLSASLAARDIRPEGAAKDAGPAMTLDLTVEQDAAATRAEATLKGGEATDVTARLRAAPLLGTGRALSQVPLEGDVRARARLARIAEILGLGEDRVTGELEGTLKVSGTLARPRLQGEARLNGGSYEGAATGTILRHVEGRARFTGDEVRLVSLTADDGQAGRLSAKGAMRLTGAADGADGLEVTLARFAALRHPSAEIQATGTVTLAGSLAAPKISGRLRIDQGEIRIPDRLGPDIVELKVTEINKPSGADTAPPSEDEPSLAKAAALALDLNIEVPGRTFVRGRGLDSEWKGNLAVSGTTAAPVIKGNLQVGRGTFAFAGKTFIVKRGAVTFPPGGGVEPEIAAMAEAKLPDILARIEISGTVSKPEIKVSSDPPLPQEEVLAQILFGRTSGQLSAIQAAQLVQTAATLSGKGGGPGIVDRIRSTLGVDVLNVESGDGERGGASLKAGNYLTEDVFLSVSQGTQPGSQKVGVEVKVTPHVTVESNVSGNADSNIGVNWKWDY